MLGLLPQAPVAPESITGTDLGGRGRYPHQGWFRAWSVADDEAVAVALVATGTSDMADRRLQDMSGQRQRVWIALALAQQTDLLLDEPTTYLDLARQVDVLDLLTALNRQRITKVVVVMHDLNLACRYADHLTAMAGGAVVAEGRRPVVTNGLSLCEIHHAACDADLLGMTPDYTGEVNHSLLQAIDGPCCAMGCRRCTGGL